jgi:hypothetical protein
MTGKVQEQPMDLQDEFVCVDSYAILPGSSTFRTKNGELGELVRFTVGEFAMFTFGIPVIPTFQVPLCCADTVPDIGTGNGAAIDTGTLTGVGVEAAGWAFCIADPAMPSTVSTAAINKVFFIRSTPFTSLYLEYCPNCETPVTAYMCRYQPRAPIPTTAGLMSLTWL